VIAAFSGIATLAFVVVSAGVGVRLLWLARRTRALRSRTSSPGWFRPPYG